ncbi:MAG: hypothetical protein LBF16_11535 [Pseudomonadales bacterium]|jgi:antitoxin (DNA-binding transcriptional repressor) of toxin-antitoxin stability system|nr:hypothetical protein [Pseudomonadales bacterium]
MQINQVSKSQFKSKALEYFREIEKSGQGIIITDHGKPALEIKPYRTKAKADPLESLRGTVIRYDDPLSPIAGDEWEAGQ